MVDSSESVGEGGFQEAKNFMWAVISNFEISNNDTLVGIIRFSTQANVMFDFQFSADNNIQLLKETIDNIPYSEGGTRTERALQLALTDLFSDKGGSRPEVPKILVVMTDGKSDNALGVARASMALKERHVTLVAVGIGEEVDMEELLLMASTAEDVIRVNTFSELKKHVGRVTDKVCDGELKCCVTDCVTTFRKILKATPPPFESGASHIRKYNDQRFSSYLF